MGRQDEQDDDNQSDDDSSSQNIDRWDSYETRDGDKDKVERKDKK